MELNTTHWTFKIFDWIKSNKKFPFLIRRKKKKNDSGLSSLAVLSIVNCVSSHLENQFQPLENVQQSEVKTDKPQSSFSVFSRERSLAVSSFVWPPETVLNKWVYVCTYVHLCLCDSTLLNGRQSRAKEEGKVEEEVCGRTEMHTPLPVTTGTCFTLP